MSGSAPTRWSRGGSDNDGFGERFAQLVADGEDVDGEARLADALCPRGARVLDVGAGMGRVAAAMAARGHTVLAVEPDRALAEQARHTYPGLPVLDADLLDLDGPALAAAGAPEAFDLVLAVGNVMIFLAEDTEVAALTRMRELLAPGGRVLLGLHPYDGPTTSRDYPTEVLWRDVEQAGLRLDVRFGSWELHPPSPSYVVAVLSHAEGSPGLTTEPGGGHSTWASS